MKARPTEYRETVYRSKTEAILARALDLAGYIYIYEPEFIDMDGWTPDFMAFNGDHDLTIELKPKAPTDTYKEQLEAHFERMLNYELKQNRTCLGNRFLFVIDPFAWDDFNDECGVSEWRFGFESSNSKVEAFCNVRKRLIEGGEISGGVIEILEKISEAKRFRFDLEYRR
jgi:hypothetical protein